MIQVHILPPNVSGVRSFPIPYLKQYCNARNYKRSTLYFALIYLFAILTNSNDVRTLNLNLAVLASVWVSVKVSPPSFR